MTYLRIFLSALFQFSSIILVDPFLYPGDTVGLTRIRERLVKSAHERRDVWSSRQEAREFLGKKGGWDDRVMDLYVVSGMPWGSRHSINIIDERRNMDSGSIRMLLVKLHRIKA